MNKRYFRTLELRAATGGPIAGTLGQGKTSRSTWTMDALPFWRHSPPQVGRIWLWVYYNKVPIYYIFYILKGDDIPLTTV